MDKINEETLSKDLSSYSSFFKTQTSMNNVDLKDTESKRDINIQDSNKIDIESNVENKQPESPGTKNENTVNNATDINEPTSHSENETHEEEMKFQEKEDKSMTSDSYDQNKKNYNAETGPADKIRITVTTDEDETVVVSESPMKDGNDDKFVSDRIIESNDATKSQYNLLSVEASNHTNEEDKHALPLSRRPSSERETQPEEPSHTATTENNLINETNTDTGMEQDIDKNISQEYGHTPEVEIFTQSGQPQVNGTSSSDKPEYQAENEQDKNISASSETDPEAGGIKEGINDDHVHHEHNSNEGITHNVDNGGLLHVQIGKTTNNSEIKKGNFFDDKQNSYHSFTPDNLTTTTNKVDEGNSQSVSITPDNHDDSTERSKEQMPTETFEDNETDFIKGISATRNTTDERQNIVPNENVSQTSIGEHHTNDSTQPMKEKSVVSENQIEEVDEVRITENSASSSRSKDSADQDKEHTELLSQNKHSDDKDVEDIKGHSDDGNLYFTGRLPTLVNMNDRSQSISTNYTSGLELNEERDVLEHPSEEGNHMENIHNNNNPGEKRVQTASKEVRELLEKMNEQIEPREGYSRGNQLTPRTMLRKAQSANSVHTEKANIVDPIQEVEKENKAIYPNQGESMTVDDINIYTSKVIRTTNTEQNSRFDNLTHMKNISNYVQDNIEAGSKSNEQRNMTENGDSQYYIKKTNKPNETYIADWNTTTVNPKSNQTKEDNLEGSKEKENHRRTLEIDIKHTEADSTNNTNNPFESPRSCTPGSQHATGIRRSTSENDLRAMIESAKMAIRDTTGDSDEYDDAMSYVSMVGGCKPVTKKTRSFAERNSVSLAQNQVDIDDKALASLICSSCLQVDRNIHKSGFCTNCKTYLCGTCISVHLMDTATADHYISPSYCKNEMEKNSYIQATGYCKDCNTFLCMKCAMKHTQLRANRHHRIIQSSFVSKQSDRNKETDKFLDDIENKLNDGKSERSSLDRTELKRRRLLTDLKDNNPYRYRFGYVPDSVYPGSKKKQTTSYTKRPKWPHSSLPALPYLVQPKFIKEKFYYPRHLGFNNRKKEIAYMSEKLKTLQSRYNLISEYDKLFLRKDMSRFKSNVGHPNESISLPDIDKGKNHKSFHVRSVKQIIEKSKLAGALRKCDFIAEHHLTLPAATYEKATDILAMDVLRNGKLAVLDRNNNNIKIYDKAFHCKAALQFHNRLVDLCASNLCPTDLYVATPKHVYEVSNEDGLDVRRKIKVEIKRIEGITSWKYGVAVISKKSNINWELRLMDYRGNHKSKLEIFNPLTCEIASSQLCHVTTSKGGRRISISDKKNFCVITVDVTSRDVQHETALGDDVEPTYLTADGDGHHNLYVSSASKIYQISKKGRVKGVVLDKSSENVNIGCIVCNKANDRLFVQTGKDRVGVYQLV